MIQKELLKRIGKALAISRRRRKLTQEDLSEKCHFTRESLSEIENGKRNFSIKKLSKLAIKLEIKLSELIKMAEDLIL